MLRSIFVGLVSFVFSIVFLVTLSFFTILTTFLNADFYKEASCFFHGTVTDWLGGDIYDRIPDVQKVATREQVVIAVKDIIKAEDFENMMMPFVGQFLAPDFDEDGVAFVSMDFSPFFEKVSTFPDVISKSICADTGECQSQELIKEQINKVFNGFYLETINEDVPTNLKSFTLQIKKQNVEILPGTTVSRDLFWDIFWILIAVNVLLLGIIALITFRPWHRVLKSVAKPVIGGVAMYALMFYALYRVYIYFESDIIDSIAKNMNSDVDVLTASSAFAGQLLWVIVENALICSAVVFVIGGAVYMAGFFGNRYSSNNG